MKRAFIEILLTRLSRLKSWLFTSLISSAFKSIGPQARVCPPLRFSGLCGISLGQGTVVHRDCWLQTIGTSAEIQIGNFAGIGMGASISAAAKIVIGDHVILGRNVYISDHAHAFKSIDKPIALQGIDNISPISIGRHSWLGQNVVILPGVSIGQHCVIGANSVVNSSIPDFSVAVGAPARIVKSYNLTSNTWESTKPV